MLPRKPLKRILKHDCPSQVSDDAVVILQQSLEQLALLISRQAAKEFQALNQRRIAYHLPPKKRLNAYMVSRAIENLFSTPCITDMGLQSRRDASPGGER